MTEIWQPIKGYKGIYEVSNLGKIKSYALDKPHIKKLSYKRMGYPYTMLYKNGRGQWVNIHRLIAKTFIPNPKNKPQVNHIDGNKQNNKVSNLEWVTHSENTIHAFKIGLMARGEEHKSAKLSDKEVREIRKKYSSGKYLQKELAEKYNVGQASISRIVLNRMRATA